MNRDLLKNMLAVNANLKVQEIEYPTKVIIIDDFFIDPYYNKLTKYFQNFLDHNVFKNNIEKFSYTLQDNDISKNNPFNFFISNNWIKFISSNFNLQLENCTNINLNYVKYKETKISQKNKLDRHPIHLEAINEHDTLEEVGLIGEESGEESVLKKSKKIIKNIFIVYQLNMKENEEYSSIGIYKGPEKDDLCLEIKPKNNRLILIEINDKMYKDFIDNNNSQSCLAQYMYSNPWRFIYRNLESINESRISKNLPIFDNLKNNKILEDINVDSDEEYQKIFGVMRPEEVLNNEDIINRLLSRIKKKILI